MADPQAQSENELSPAGEAAERAGSIVTDHVRSIIHAAQTRAAEIERNAQEEAQQMRVDAHEAASRVLERIDSLEGNLGGLASDLRSETSSLSGDLDRWG